MDEKEAEARPVMGTIFLVVYVTRYDRGSSGGNSVVPSTSPQISAFFHPLDIILFIVK